MEMHGSSIILCGFSLVFLWFHPYSHCFHPYSPLLKVEPYVMESRQSRNQTGPAGRYKGYMKTRSLFSLVLGGAICDGEASVWCDGFRSQLVFLWL